MFLIKNLTNRHYYIDCEKSYQENNTRLVEYLNVPNDHAPAWAGGEMYPDLEFSADAFNKLIDGYDPKTGKALVKNAGDEQKQLGKDICFTLPKGASIAYALMSAPERKNMDAAQRRAVQKTMDRVVRNLIKQSNFDEQKKDVSKVDIVYFAFNHYENREQEPHIHTHLELPNIARFTYADGSVKSMAVNTADLLNQQEFITAYYLSTLEQELRKEPVNLFIDGSNHKNKFSVAGISQEQEDALSKRTTEIRDEIWRQLEYRGAVFSSDTDRNALIDAVIENNSPYFSDRETDAIKEQIGKATKELKTVASYAEAIGVIKKKALSAVDPLAYAAAQAQERPQILPLPTPADLLNEITNNEAVFTDWQLKAKILQARRGQALPSDVDTYLAAQISELRQHGLIQLDAGLFTTKQIIQAETAIHDIGSKLAPAPAVSRFLPAQADALLTSQFDQIDPAQKAACLVATSRQLAVITGDAGTGKTSSVIKFAALATQTAGGKVWGTATQGKTSKALSDASIPDEQCLNTKALIASYRNDKIQFSRGDRIIVDEAGMVGAEDLAALMQIAHEHHADLTLVGDAKQLAAVSAGRPFVDLVHKTPEANQARLFQNYRAQTEESAAVAAAFRDREGQQGLDLLRSQNNLHLAADKQDAYKQAVDQYFATPGDSKALIAFKNEDVNRLNDLVRNKLIKSGLVEKAQVGLEVTGANRNNELEKRYFSVNDKIVFTEITKLGKGKRLENGTFATILEVNHQQMKIRTEKNEEHTIDLAKHRSFNHAYAISSYKAQGLTANNAIIYSDGQTSANRVYVEMSRARLNTKLVMLESNQDDFVKNAVKEQVKTSALDYEMGKQVAAMLIAQANPEQTIVAEIENTPRAEAAPALTKTQTPEKELATPTPAIAPPEPRKSTAPVAVAEPTITAEVQFLPAPNRDTGEFAKEYQAYRRAKDSPAISRDERDQLTKTWRSYVAGQCTAEQKAEIDRLVQKSKMLLR